MKLEVVVVPVSGVDEAKATLLRPGEAVQAAREAGPRAEAAYATRSGVTAC